MALSEHDRIVKRVAQGLVRKGNTVQVNTRKNPRLAGWVSKQEKVRPSKSSKVGLLARGRIPKKGR